MYFDVSGSVAEEVPSVAQALLPEDGYLSRLLESPPKRKCFMVLHKKLRSDRQATIAAFEARLHEYVRTLKI